MPIKTCNRHRYPADWPTIRTRILARAGDCCEGSPRHPDCRAAHGQPHPVTGSRVVLTVAHLDNTYQTQEEGPVGKSIIPHDLPASLSCQWHNLLRHPLRDRESL